VRAGIGAVWIPVTILAVFVVLVYLGMWHGWRNRARKHDCLEVHRPGTSFSIPAPALAGARAARGLAGKVIPPHGLLVVTWRHGGYVLDTGFRLTDLSGPHPAIAGSPPDTSVDERHERWIRAIEAIVKESAA